MSAVLDMLYTNSSIMFRERRNKKNLDYISTNFKSAPFELFKLLMLNTFFFFFVFIHFTFNKRVAGDSDIWLMPVSVDVGISRCCPC